MPGPVGPTRSPPPHGLSIAWNPSKPLVSPTPTRTPCLSNRFASAPHSTGLTQRAPLERTRPHVAKTGSPHRAIDASFEVSPAVQSWNPGIYASPLKSPPHSMPLLRPPSLFVVYPPRGSNESPRPHSGENNAADTCSPEPRFRADTVKSHLGLDESRLLVRRRP